MHIDRIVTTQAHTGGGPVMHIDRIFTEQAQLSYAVARAASAPTEQDRKDWLKLARRSVELIGELLDLAQMECAA